MSFSNFYDQPLTPFFDDSLDEEPWTRDSFVPFPLPEDLKNLIREDLFSNNNSSSSSPSEMMWTPEQWANILSPMTSTTPDSSFDSPSVPSSSPSVMPHTAHPLARLTNNIRPLRRLNSKQPSESPEIPSLTQLCLWKLAEKISGTPESSVKENLKTIPFHLRRKLFSSMQQQRLTSSGIDSLVNQCIPESRARTIEITDIAKEDIKTQRAVAFKIMSNQTHLQSISFLHCHLDFLQQHSVSFRMLLLTELQISHCTISDDTLGCMVQAAPLLKKLSIRHLPNITFDHWTQDTPQTHPHRLSELSIESCARINSLSLVQFILQKGSASLESVSFNDCDNWVTDDLVRPLADLLADRRRPKGSEGPLLKSISFDAAFEVTSEAMRYLSQQCCHLSSVDLQNCVEISDDAIQSIAENSGKNLESVNLNNCNSCTDTSIQALATHCPSLKHLSLRRCFSIADASVHTLIQACPKIEELHLPTFSFAEQALLEKVAKNLKQLKVLSCGKEVPINASLATQLRTSCPGLSSFEFRTTSSTINSSLRALTGWSQETDLSSIRHLNLTGCSELKSKTLVQIVQNCPRLEHLQISHCPQLTSDVCFELACVFSLRKPLGLSSPVVRKEGRKNQLTKLVMNGLNLSDEGVIALIKTCPNMQYLSLLDCRGLTPKSGLVIAQTCRQLTSFSSADNQIDSSVLRTMMRNCPLLTELHVNGGKAISTSAFRDLFRSSNSEIARSEEEGDASPTLAHSPIPLFRNHLEVVHLRHCPHLKDNVFEEMEEGLPLTKVFVIESPSITSQSIQFLTEKSSFLRSIYLSDVGFGSDDPLLPLLRSSFPLLSLCVL